MYYIVRFHTFILKLIKMKNFVFIGFILAIIISCSTSKSNFSSKSEVTSKAEVASKATDTIRIANEKLEYEIIIIDPGFNSWFVTQARPRNFYSQSYMEARNRIWVLEWNNRARQPLLYDTTRLYELEINYQNNIDYGYEVNYMLFNYLTYFQIVNNISLGTFMARI
jgi:hypothetical protein